MLFRVRELVLWPRHGDEKPEHLRFVSDELNVISGVSKTGKSAIIPIIDYCLGSDTCAIPVSTIRDRCSWFGIIVETEQGQMLLARREPGAQRSTGDMYVKNGKAIEPPVKIDGKNTTVEVVKRTLDELAGLTQLDFDPDKSGFGFKERPSFRDLMAFTFQTQNIVANQNILFFKGDTHEHREKLRTIFPYVLGAISPELLAKQHELSQLRRELLRKERELASLRDVSERWISEIRAWVSQARELGLVSPEIDVDSPVPTLIDALRAVTIRTRQEPQVTSESVERAVSELVALQREESERATVLAQSRRRLAEMELLRDTIASYGGRLHVERDRLKVAEWIEGLHADKQSCPVCGQEMDDEGGSALPSLLEALRQHEEGARQAADVPATFDRELQRVRSDVRAATEQLDGVRHRIRALTQASEIVRARHDATLEASRFVGRLEQALQHYENLGSDEGLSAEVVDLADRVKALEAEVREGDVERRVSLALRRVSTLMQRIIPKLDAERPEDPVSLSVTDLTIKVAGQEREDYLWEIGSGSNWLSYHLAAIVALHQFFLELGHSPVPAFLVLDQPSQVYFPKQLSPAQLDGSEQPYQDEDVVAVRRVFSALADVVKSSRGQLQIMVLDHVTDTVWGDIEPLRRVADWRDGSRLVPESWAASSPW